MGFFSRKKRAQPPADDGPAIGELSDAERRWLDDNLADLAGCGVDAHDAEQLGALYDAQLAQWERGRPTPGPMRTRRST